MSFVLVIVTVVICNAFIDKSLSLHIDKLFYSNPHWVKYTSALPDTLFIVVCIIEMIAWSAYLYSRNKRKPYVVTACMLDIAYGVPVAYVLKDVLKFIFGRINTRNWLVRPDLYGFHWFHGGGNYNGFPSGHLAVFAALTAALWRFYPRYRYVYLLIITFLAAALIMTNYHFVSDIIAGIYLGVLVETNTFRILHRYRATT